MLGCVFVPFGDRRNQRLRGQDYDTFSIRHQVTLQLWIHNNFQLKSSITFLICLNDRLALM